jgi:hypothetical protein
MPIIRLVLFSSNCLTVAITASLLVLTLHIRCRDGYMSISNAQNNVYQVLRNIFERNAGYHERIYRQRSRSWTMPLIRIVLFSSNYLSVAFTASLVLGFSYVPCNQRTLTVYDVGTARAPESGRSSSCLPVLNLFAGSVHSSAVR